MDFSIDGATRKKKGRIHALQLQRLVFRIELPPQFDAILGCFPLVAFDHNTLVCRHLKKAVEAGLRKILKSLYFAGHTILSSHFFRPLAVSSAYAIYWMALETETGILGPAIEGVNPVQYRTRPQWLESAAMILRLSLHGRAVASADAMTISAAAGRPVVNMLSSLLRKIERPVFSIVVATYNRPQQLTGLLRSLSSIEYPRERFEVIVVDDGSTMPIEPPIAEFQSLLNLCFLRQPHSGAASARQTGVERAQGFYLAFTDDDCQAAPGWLRGLELALTATERGAAGGRTINGLTDNLYSSATQTLENYLRVHWNGNPAEMGFFGTANLAMPADLYRSIGGFDLRPWPHGGEDRDLCARWTEAGYCLIHAPDAVVHHFHELNLFTFLRQHFGYGRGAFRVRQASAQRGQRRIKLEPLSFYFRLPLFGLMETRSWQALPTAILLVGAQVSNAAGFILEWARQRTLRESSVHADLHHRL